MKGMEKGILGNNKGFTLIEIIMVIVILGILAATAIPKYYSIKDDAADATAHGITSGLRGAVSVLYSKNIVGGTSGTTAYTIGDVVTSAQVSGVTMNVTTSTVTASIGGTTYSWSLSGVDVPTAAGTIVEDSGW